MPNIIERFAHFLIFVWIFFNVLENSVKFLKEYVKMPENLRTFDKNQPPPMG